MTIPTTVTASTPTPRTVITLPTGEQRLVAYWDNWTKQVVDLEGNVVVIGNQQYTISLDQSLLPWKNSIIAAKTPYFLVAYPSIRTTLGADPEVFAVDAAGVVIPAFTWLPPKIAAARFATGTMFYDGFQAEWTVDPATRSNPQCLCYHADHLQTGMKTVRDAVRRLHPDARLSVASVVPILPEMFEKYDPEHFQLGCSPSKNAYGEEPLRAGDAAQLPFRSAGCHMHMGIGGTDTDGPDQTIPKEKIHSAVRMMDRVIGVAGVTFGQAYRYPERRTMYGRAGEYRYGITLEYRVPEVLMLAHPATWNLLWDLGRLSMWLGLRGMDFLWDAEDDEVRQAINKSDVTLAGKLLRRNEPLLRRMIETVYPGISEPQVSFTLATLYDGIGVAVEDPTAMETNWLLDGVWARHNHSPGTTWMSCCNRGIR